MGGGGSKLQSHGSDLKTLDSSDLAVPETINRNAWQEGGEGTDLSLLQNALKQERERAGTF